MFTQIILRHQKNEKQQDPNNLHRRQVLSRSTPLHRSRKGGHLSRIRHRVVVVVTLGREATFQTRAVVTMVDHRVDIAIQRADSAVRVWRRQSYLRALSKLSKGLQSLEDILEAHTHFLRFLSRPIRDLNHSHSHSKRNEILSTRLDRR
jgi:predicted dienelactone hydrolase